MNVPESVFRAYRRPPALRGRRKYLFFVEQLIPASKRRDMTIEARLVCRRLLDWRNGADHFLRWTRTDADCKNFVMNSVFRHSSVMGRAVSIASVIHDRFQLAKLIREARSRAILGDWEWFNWLDRYGCLIESDNSETFEDQYSHIIQSAGKQRRALAIRQGPTVSDEQIKAELRKHPTQQEVADSLGITVRQLRRRIKLL
ncbi:MAG: hypothetical protein ABUS47_06630 [Steroidobacter sp.]